MTPTDPYAITITEAGLHSDWIVVQQCGETIYLTPDTALDLAYKLMSVGKGQGSGATHTISRPSTTPPGIAKAFTNAKP